MALCAGDFETSYKSAFCLMTCSSMAKQGIGNQYANSCKIWLAVTGNRGVNYPVKLVDEYMHVSANVCFFNVHNFCRYL